MIDHVKSIQTLGCAYWKKARNKNLRIGDICYLFPFKADHDCYKLIPTSAMYEGEELSLDTLEEIGINRHSQFKELNEYQEVFLSKYFM